MKIVRYIVDNATSISGFVTAVIGLLAAFDIVTLTADQTAAVMGLLGAVTLLLAATTTQAKAKVLSIVDREGVIRNGPAAVEPTGESSNVLQHENGTLTPAVTVSPSLLNA